MNNERGFRYREHTADVIIEAWGPTLEAAFEEAAKAMFTLITDIEKVEPREEFSIEVKGFDLENLLYQWLEELLYYHDSQNLVFSKFQVMEISRVGEDYLLKAKVYGEKFDRKKHIPGTVVKAVTYAEMRVENRNGKWFVSAVLDI
ncbi:MAG: archease [Thermoprotei archaeon]|nr:MAG: archease [Thermoprotei archaeon]